ncbi:flotillin-2-like protein [Dinothrombium tinctorium]|uniref:Flotillin-2-like protein n=1 Tax=Dinothrombium tinctorium TaxID=1965070 RepID=A0A3S3SRE0_9ACAR|nr:flotillin-2-like protein [Dinothrombium tinctorium]
MGNIHTVGPNEALIVSGGCFSDSRKFIVGGWAWAWMFITDVQTMSLEIMTLKPKCEDVETSHGVPLTVNAVVQCKFMSNKEFLEIAAQQFLGRDIKHVKEVILQTLEGHLTAIIGTITVEEVYQDRAQFAKLVKEMCEPDLAKMGIEILSFTIKDVTDHVQYLSSLGKARTAEVQRDASIGVANAERDAGIGESTCEKIAMDTKYECDSKIQDHHRVFQLQKQQFISEVNARRAEAQLAYELQSAKLQQVIRNEELEIDVVERRKLIDVEEKEIERKEKELTATIRLPAEAEAYTLQVLASGKRFQILELSRADAEKIKLVGASEAFSMEAKGNAEALTMKLKAEAYKQYTDAATLAQTLEILPQMAAEVVSPLYKTKEIVLIGTDDDNYEGIKKIEELANGFQSLIGR